MADQPASSRSRVAIPLIVGGFLLLLAMLAFVPLLKCPDCAGTGFRTVQIMTFAPAKTTDKDYPCGRCEGHGRLSLRRRLVTERDEKAFKNKVELAVTPGARNISEISYRGFSKTDAAQAVGSTE